MITVTGKHGGTGGFAPPATWGDSLARVVTVGGLGAGLAIIGAAVTAALWHSTGNLMATLVITSLIVGMTGGGGALYLDYIKRHTRLGAVPGSPAAKFVSSAAALLVLFVSAFLVSTFMLPLLVVGVLQIRAEQRGTTWRERPNLRESSWRERADRFIGDVLPRIAVF